MSERLFFNNIREAWRILRYKPSPDVSTGVQIVTGDPTQDAFLRVAELEREIAALREDKARLDWLDSKTDHGVNTLAHKGYEQRAHVYSNQRWEKMGNGNAAKWDHFWGPNVRAAIDAARK